MGGGELNIANMGTGAEGNPIPTGQQDIYWKAPGAQEDLERDLKRKELFFIPKSAIWEER